MLLSTKGIVFKTIKFQETSLIVKIFTMSHGLQTFMVKGIRSTKANGKAGIFQPGMLLDIVMNYQESKQFNHLREYRSLVVYSTVMDDVRKSSVLMFLIEVLAQCIEENSEDERLYTFIEQSLVNFDQDAFDPDFHLHFLLEFMKHLGIYPRGRQSSSLLYFNIKEGEFTDRLLSKEFICSADDSSLLDSVLSNQPPPLKRADRQKLTRLILDYFGFHMENFKGVKSLSILEAVLS